MTPRRSKPDILTQRRHLADRDVHHEACAVGADTIAAGRGLRQFHDTCPASIVDIRLFVTLWDCDCAARKEVFFPTNTAARAVLPKHCGVTRYLIQI